MSFQEPSRFPMLRRLSVYAKRLSAFLDRINLRIAPPDEETGDAPTSLARAPILFGVWTIFIVFGVFGLWAALAPLDSAAVASGQVVFDSNKKTVQHLEGGIVEEIMVREGERVKKGQGLVRLNATTSKAQLDLYKSNFLTAKATEARLMAERDDKDEITFPKAVLDLQNERRIAELIANEKRFFNSRRETLGGRINILKQRIAQSEQEINGLRAQVSSATNQIALLQEQIDVVEKLLAQGNALRPRLLNLKQQAEELKGQRGSNQAMISRAEQAITQSQLEIANQRSDLLNKVNAELQDVQSKIGDLEERIRASSDIVSRIVIASPVDGLVTGLAVHTVGGVIAPGEAIMSIVPIDDKLIVEAQVLPQDIDVVREGLPARVRLTAYKARRVPMINGTVVNVSGDSFEDSQTRAKYFVARVEVSPNEMKALKDVELSPGMPAQVLIVTGERTMLSYMMGPIRDALTTAFREQ